MNDPISANYVELDELLRSFLDNLLWALDDKFIVEEFFRTVEYNSQSVAHSRIHALLAKTGFDLNYMVEIESGLGRFRPDIKLWKNDEFIFLIEYESTNSSDSRVLSNDLPNYEKTKMKLPTDEMPKYWLIIYTLPDFAVEDWSRCDYNKSDYAFASVLKNPHRFYKKGFREPRLLCSPEPPKCCPDIADTAKYPNVHHYTDAEDWSSNKIFLINLTIDGLEIVFPERFNKRYNFGRQD
jgi:hypothetical protein